MTTEVMTTHQKIQEQHQRNTADIIGDKPRMRHAQQVITSDIEQIKMVLQALMDKLTGLDMYVRSQHQRTSSSNQFESKPEPKQADAKLVGNSKVIEGETLAKPQVRTLEHDDAN